MKRQRGGSSILVTASLALVGLAPALGRAAGLPEDWSHRHLIISNPPALEEEVLWTQSAEDWWALVTDPRFVGAERRSEAAKAAQTRKAANAIASAERQGTLVALGAKKPPPPPPPLGEGDWSMNLGSNAKVGAGQYPAKYGFGTTTASCSDFVVFNTGLAGSPTQASIRAYTNLYSGCGSTVPSVKWQYNTGGAIPTSAVLSLDGTQLAFVQTSGGTASLVLLKPGTGNALVSLTSVLPANYPGCTAPCMTSFPLGANVTRSAPFYDYQSDVLYIGNDSGLLRKFKGVFAGTPAEVTEGWPVTLGSAILTSPVYDFSSRNVFVGSQNGLLYSVASTGGSPIASGQLARTGQIGVGDAPVVDSWAERVYVFVDCDNAGGTGDCRSGQHQSAVFQLPTSFVAGALGSKKNFATVRRDGTLYAGTFDDVYYTSTSWTSPSGYLYVCANTLQGSAALPTLWRVPISGNNLGTPVQGPVLTTAEAICSPVTELYDSNTGTDRIFLSVQNSSITTGACGGAGCVMSFDNPGTNFGTAKTPTAAQPAAGGTSGIIIDNTATSPVGASTIYYSTLANGTCATSGGTGGCAVQRLQSNLN